MQPLTHEQAQAKLQAVLDAYSQLTPSGFNYKEGRTPKKDAAQLARERAQFNIENFIVAYQFCLLVPATKGIAKRGSTSYGIKHTAEKYYGTYISNGELIAAAIAAGFRFEAFPDSPNVFFNMSRGKLNALHQEANNENAGHQR